MLKKFFSSPFSLMINNNHIIVTIHKVPSIVYDTNLFLFPHYRTSASLLQMNRVVLRQKLCKEQINNRLLFCLSNNNLRQIQLCFVKYEKRRERKFYVIICHNHHHRTFIIIIIICYLLCQTRIECVGVRKKIRNIFVTP